MGDTKMFLFFSNISTTVQVDTNETSQRWLTSAEVNYCPDSLKDYFTDEGVDRRNVWKE